MFRERDILTADDIRRPGLTLEQSVKRHGWPKLEDARGQVMFLLDNDPGAIRHAYTAGRPNLEGRPIFTNSRAGFGDAAFIKRNEPRNANTAQIQDLVTQGYYVRTRSDLPLETVHSGDTAMLDAALRSGAQVISTDFPQVGMSARYGSDFVAELPGGGPVRCNPVNAPRRCDRDDLEPKRRFDLQAHRGGLGLVTESTLEAFANAIELGVTTLELDVQITEDRWAVVTHDRRVSANKCRDTAPVRPGDPEFPYVGKYVKDLTLRQVRTLACDKPLPEHPGQRVVPGARMPLLRQVFDLADCYGARKLRFNVETKVEAGAPHRDRAARPVRAADRGRGPACAAARPRLDPELRLGRADADARGRAAAAARGAHQRRLLAGRPARARRRGSAASTSTSSAGASPPRPTRSAPTRSRPSTATRRTARSAIRTTCRTRRRSSSTRRTIAAST